jgi:hypothetical protein
MNIKSLLNFFKEKKPEPLIFNPMGLIGERYLANIERQRTEHLADIRTFNDPSTSGMYFKPYSEWIKEYPTFGGYPQITHNIKLKQESATLLKKKK